MVVSQPVPPHAGQSTSSSCGRSAPSPLAGLTGVFALLALHARKQLPHSLAHLRHLLLDLLPNLLLNLRLRYGLGGLVRALSLVNVV